MEAPSRSSVPAGPDNARRVRREGVLYGLATAVPAAISFVSLAFYSRWFAPEEYGYFSLALAAISLGGTVLGGWLSNFVYRFYDQHRRSDALGPLVSTSAWVVGALALLLLLAGLVASRFVDDAIAVWVLFAAALVGPELAQMILLQFARLEHRAGGFTAARLLAPSLRLGVTFLLMVYASNDIAGLRGGTAAGYAGALVILLVAVGRVLSRFRVSLFDPALLLRMFRYGLPLVFFGLAGWVMSSSDRYVIQWLLGPAATGLYAMGYSLAWRPIELLSSSVVLLAGPLIWERLNAAGEAAASETVRQYGTGYLSLALPAAVGLAYLAEPIVQAFFGTDYFAARVIVVPVALGSLVAGYQSLLVKPWEAREQTLRVAGFVLAGALLNIAANLLLIPRFGIAGAAWATFFSYLAVSLAMTIAARRLGMKATPPVRGLVLAAVSTGAMVAVLRLTDHLGAWGEGVLAARVGLGAISYGLCYWVLLVLFRRWELTKSPR